MNSKFGCKNQLENEGICFDSLMKMKLFDFLKAWILI